MSRRIAMLASTGVAMITAVHLWHQLRVERELRSSITLEPGAPPRA